MTSPTGAGRWSFDPDAFDEMLTTVEQLAGPDDDQPPAQRRQAALAKARKAQQQD